ncbi:MAG: exodeoxyribonuclease III [Patescibacteria group bacterium]
MPSKSSLLISWNVNGVRAVLKKGFLAWMKEVSPDVLCIQETKAQIPQIPEDAVHPEGYIGVWSFPERKGYSGVATFIKDEPKAIISTFGEPLLDEEGRIILTEHEDFYLFNVYFPNGGRDDDRLKYKMKFYDRFLDLIEEYRKKKPVIFCGDVNTAHHEIDIARPKENEKNSGFMPIERKWLDKLEEHGFVDAFRHFHPDAKDEYSWWDVKSGARLRNVGWRIDYFWVDKAILPKVKEAFIWQNVRGSDHCPVEIRIEAK